MRVLHLNAGNMYGGVETFLTTLAREAPAAPGMESSFAVCFEGRFSAGLASLGRAPHVLGQVRLSRPQSVMHARRELRDLLAREAYDVVVCHQPWASVVFASVIRSAGLPVVLWAHMASRGQHWLERLCKLTRPDLVICNSRFTAGAVSQWLADTPVEYVYYPVSAPAAVDSDPTRTGLRSEFETAPSDVVLVQVSRMEEWKGQRVLLSALSRLRDVPFWTCWVVGGPQRRSEARYLRDLRSVVRREGIESRMRFVGERRDVHAILRAADVFCQLNTAPEPFGLSLVEALHAGIPVVTSGIGGACEIVDGSCGILCPPGDVGACASSLRRLIEDRDLAVRLGAEARRRRDALCNVAHQMRQIQIVLSGAVAPHSSSAEALQADL